MKSLLNLLGVLVAATFVLGKGSVFNEHFRSLATS